MVQLKCPVCNHEYTEGTVEFCSRCSWNLASYLLTLGVIPSEIQKREEQTLLWAKKVWEKLSQLNKQNLLLQQQLELVKKDNRPLLINSLVEQHLQNLSSNIQYLPQMLTLLQQINENIAYQSQNFSSLSQSHQAKQTLVNETVLENEVDERKDLSNPTENINIHDSEVYYLIENYNQQADFPDKIEVSETASSKELRWSGSQAPAIFERNIKGRGEYWIIHNQYLVPKPKQKINEHSYKTLSTLFECHNYEQNATDNMILIKPAKVSNLDGEEKWQLEEMGILEF